MRPLRRDFVGARVQMDVEVLAGRPSELPRPPSYLGPHYRYPPSLSQRYFWGQNVTLNPSRYLNGGVIVWGQAARKVLVAPWIVQRIGDFFSALNDQHFIAATLAAAPQLRVHSLPREFDYMPYVVRRAFAAPDAHSGQRAVLTAPRRTHAPPPHHLQRSREATVR